MALIAVGARAARFHFAERVAVTASEKQTLRESTGADAVEMESEAIRTICRQNKIPSATIRVILDTASDDLPLDFNRLMTDDQQMNYLKLAMTLAKSPARTIQLLAFQRQCRLAADNLAQVLTWITLANLLNGHIE
jgi:hypothetical protein